MSSLNVGNNLLSSLSVVITKVATHSIVFSMTNGFWAFCKIKTKVSVISQSCKNDSSPWILSKNSKRNLKIGSTSLIRLEYSLRKFTLFTISSRFSSISKKNSSSSRKFEQSLMVMKQNFKKSSSSGVKTVKFSGKFLMHKLINSKMLLS